MTNWDWDSNTWKTLYVKCSLDPFFYISRLESESEKKLRVKLQKECDCRDGGGNHDSWLQGKRGDISLTGQGQDDKTYKLWWSWPKPLEDKLIINNKILNQDEVFHIMDSITRDRQECYVVRNSSVRLKNCENFYQLLKFLRGPSFKVNDRYFGLL